MTGSVKFLMLLFLQVLFLVCLGQDTTITITGSIKDSSGLNPLPRATVTLFYKSVPQSVYKITVTNNNGEYQLALQDTGTYWLTISHAGYQEHRQSLTVDQNGYKVLPEIVLIPADNNTLENVVVTATKPLIQMELDKLIYNVESDPTAKGSAAIEMFRKLPFISVDGEDNVRMNGQSNFKILLDGRETAMFARNMKEALRGFPAELISKIEIITSPSAKYDAEGVEGIINIITKKKLAGYNGYLYSYVNTNNYYSSGASFNVKSGRFGFSGYFGATKGHQVPASSFSETIPLVQTFYTNRTIKGNQLNSYSTLLADVEFSWAFDSLNKLVAYGYLGDNNSSLCQDNTITTQFHNTWVPLLGYYTLNSEKEYPGKNYGIDFINKSRRNQGRQLELHLFFDRGRYGYTINSELADDSSTRFVLNRDAENTKQFTMQADLILPFNKNQKFELGAKSIFRNADASYESRTSYAAYPDWTVDPENSDLFDFSQNVYGLYALYSLNAKKSGLQLGARTEWTDVNGNFISSHTIITSGYTSFLPHLQYARKFSNLYSTVITYNQRIVRPGIKSLNPFVYNNDSLNISSGNPNLKPQINHNLAWQHRFLKGSFASGLTLAGAYSGNLITRYTTLDRTTGVSHTTWANLGRSLQYSANLNMNLKLNKNWNLSLNGEIYYNDVRRGISPFQSFNGSGGGGSINTSYKAGKLLMFNAQAGFLRLPLAAQVQNDWQHWYGSGVILKILKEKVSISVNAANFLDKYFDYNSTVKDLHFNTNNRSTSLYRKFSVRLVWNFGRLKKEGSKKRGVSDDDQLEDEK